MHFGSEGRCNVLCRNTLKGNINHTNILMVALTVGAYNWSPPKQKPVWEGFALYPAPVFAEELEALDSRCHSAP